MPVAIQNLESGPTVFSDLKENIAIEWQGQGDPAGGDVQYVPDSVLENVHFLKAINRGVFLRVDEDEAEERFAAQREAFATAKAAQSNDVIDRESERVLADVTVAEDGKVAQREAEEEPTRGQANTPGRVIEETDARDSEGRPIEQELKVTIAPKERG